MSNEIEKKRNKTLVIFGLSVGILFGVIVFIVFVTGGFKEKGPKEEFEESQRQRQYEESQKQRQYEESKKPDNQPPSNSYDNSDWEKKQKEKEDDVRRQYNSPDMKKAREEDFQRQKEADKKELEYLEKRYLKK